MRTLFLPIRSSYFNTQLKTQNTLGSGQSAIEFFRIGYKSECHRKLIPKPI